MNIHALRQAIGSRNDGTPTLQITGNLDIKDKKQAEIDIKEIEKCNDQLRENIYICKTAMRLKNLTKITIEQALTDKLEKDIHGMEMLLDIGEKLLDKLNKGIKNAR